MQEMTNEEYREFLLGSIRTAKLATIRPDGRPHVAPVWFELDGETLLFMTGETTVKGRNLHHEPRVSLCVDDERPPFAFVVIEGRAQLFANDPDMLYWSTRIGRRYMGEERAEEFGHRNAVPGELLVRVTPTKVIAQKDVAD